MRLRSLTAAVCLLLLSSCGGPNPSQKALSELRAGFVHAALAFSPVTAARAGYHRHGKLVLDSLVDDMSSSALDRERVFYHSVRRRLTQIKLEDLTPEEAADFGLIRTRTEARLLELERIRRFRHDAALYTGLIGGALRYPLIFEYAPVAERARDLIGRLGGIPALLEAARTNLVDSAEEALNEALEQNDINEALIRDAISPLIPASLTAEYRRAAEPALDALRAFSNFLIRDMAQRGEGEWRLGRDTYALAFHHAFGQAAPAQVLAEAEADMASLQARLRELVLKTQSNPAGGQARAIEAALGRVAEPHSGGDRYLEEVRHALAAVHSFAAGKRLVPAMARETVVSETPDSVRGFYPAGGTELAPVLEPQLGPLFWVTPPPAPRAAPRRGEAGGDDAAARLLAMREAFPGRCLQAAFACQVEPADRRLLRASYGSEAYVEGWPHYSSGVLLEAGFADSTPELRLLMLRDDLRAAAGAVVDIRLHTMGMTDQQALELLRNQAYFTATEAREQLRCAIHTPCRLPAQWIGRRAWLAAQDRYRQIRGAGFQPAEFQQRALRQGAVSFSSLEAILTAQVQAEARSR